MHPETVIAFARMSELNRRLPDPLTSHRYEAIRRHTEAQRTRRRDLVARVHRAVEAAAHGRRIARPATAA